MPLRSTLALLSRHSEYRLAHSAYTLAQSDYVQVMAAFGWRYSPPRGSRPTLASPAPIGPTPHTGYASMGGIFAMPQILTMQAGRDRRRELAKLASNDLAEVSHS
ncbi:hypothetical protein GCM10010336_74320 [Streptomyces goshikiensis]|nr:hypothetical protein GCM10010336_74320 [Streptomyces goshikiensis]